MIKVNNTVLRGLLYRKQYEAAKYIEIHPSTLNKKLSGERDWTISELNELAKFLDVPLDEFVELKKAA